jgi:predicted Zn-dependent protease
MFPRAILSVVLVSAAASITLSASAEELREPRARLALDVPDGWRTQDKSDYVLAFPSDESFHLRMAGVTTAVEGSKSEDVLFHFLEHHLSHVAVTQRNPLVQYGDYLGYEMLGTGREHRGAAARWFALVLTDKNDATKRLVVLATGTDAGYDRNAPVVVEALKNLRGY